jgi:hypothetical protein
MLHTWRRVPAWLASGLLLSSLLLVSAAALSAQHAAATTQPADSGYPVSVEGREVLRIYENIGSFSAHDRAQRGTERLESLVYSPADDIANIASVDSAFGTEITLGDKVLLIVTDDDAKHLHVSRQMLAQYYVRQIREAISVARQQHGRKFLITAAIYALVTLAAYVFLVWLVVIGSRRLLKALQPNVARIKGIKIQQSEIVAGDRVAAFLRSAVRLLRVVLLFLFTWVFLATEFNYFPWTRAHGKQLLSYILTPVQVVAHAFLNYLPNLFYIAVIVTVMYYVMKFIRLLAREFERGNIRIPGFYPEWIQPTYKIIRFLLIAFTAVVI